MASNIEVAKRTLAFLRGGTLRLTDGIITLSLRRKGTRPRPGRRQEWPKGLRRELWRSQRGLCVYCRARLGVGMPSHIDHVVPVAQGGFNQRDNLQLLCSACNLRKADRTDAEFRHRYRDLLPQQRGEMPARRLRQEQFRRVTESTSDATSYTLFKSGRYITAAQRITTGAVSTGVGVALLVYLPVYIVAAPQESSVLLITSLALGTAAGGWVRLRAKWTGQDQEE